MLEHTTFVIYPSPSSLDKAEISHLSDDPPDILQIRKVLGVDAHEPLLSAITSVVKGDFCSNPQLVVGSCLRYDSPNGIDLF